MKSAYLEYKSDLKELATAYTAITLSDAFINILHKRADEKVLKEWKLDQFLARVIKIYPDRYVRELFLVKSVTLLEEYLKKRLLEEFHRNETSVKNFLSGYLTERKLTINDVISGPKKLAISFLDDIIFHNLPKVEKIYFLTFKLDLKNLCDFKRLMIIVKMRHVIVHEGGKKRGSREKVKTHSLQTCIDEINKLVENIEFSLKKGRPKRVVKTIKIDGWDKLLFQESTQDIVDYEHEKFRGIHY